MFINLVLVGVHQPVYVIEQPFSVDPRLGCSLKPDENSEKHPKLIQQVEFPLAKPAKKQSRDTHVFLST
jgi:hypothetical protein